MHKLVYAWFWPKQYLYTHFISPILCSSYPDIPILKMSDQEGLHWADLKLVGTPLLHTEVGSKT